MGVGDIGDYAQLEFDNRFNETAKKRSKTPCLDKNRQVSKYTVKKTNALRANSTAGTIFTNKDSADYNLDNSYMDIPQVSNMRASNFPSLTANKHIS